jgi:hypothetical protein
LDGDEDLVDDLFSVVAGVSDLFDCLGDDAHAFLY